MAPRKATRSQVIADQDGRIVNAGVFSEAALLCLFSMGTIKGTIQAQVMDESVGISPRRSVWPKNS